MLDLVGIKQHGMQMGISLFPMLFNIYMKLHLTFSDTMNEDSFQVCERFCSDKAKIMQNT